MGILEFIFGIILALLVAIVILGSIMTIWDTRKLEAENENLKLKMEYKKSKERGGKNDK